MPERPTPFSVYRTQVREEWLDYNGHLHDASYGIVLSDANEAWFAALDLSAGYRATCGASFYTVECHLRYLAECTLGQRLSAATIVVAAGAKTVRLYTELLHEDGSPAATGDSLYVHVDTELGAVTAMPSDRLERIQDMLAAHAALRRPTYLGLGVGAAPAGAGAS
jgi:acyl-CoA thioester hydrolase